MQEKLQQNESIKERIIQFVENQRIVKKDFFHNIESTSANFRGIQLKSSLSSTTIERIISNYPKLNLYWMITGKGEMIRDNNYEEENICINKVQEPEHQNLNYDYERLLAAEKEINLLLRDKIKMLLETIENLKKEVEHYEPGPDVSQSSKELKK